MLATNGKPGVATLDDKVEAGFSGATIVGWVIFSGVTHYTTRAAWAAAVDRHLVPDDDAKPYGWKDGETPSSDQGWHACSRSYVFSIEGNH